MVSESTGRAPDTDEGSWESLAENLFGIDFKQAGPSEDLATDDLGLEDELFASPVPRPAEPEPPAEAAPGVPRAEAEGPPESLGTPVSGRGPHVEVEVDLSFEEDLSFDEDDLSFDEPDSADAEGDAEDVQLIEGGPSREPVSLSDADLDDDEPAEAFDADLDPGDQAEEPEADDTYWDALKDWEWSEADETAAAEPPSRGGRPGRPGRGGRPAPPRYVPRAVVEPEEPAWAEGREEFVEDPEFGAGLLEGERPPAREVPAGREAARPREPERAARPREPRREAASIEAEQEPSAPHRERRDEGESGEEGRGRRRRRRGRGRREEREAAPPERSERDRGAARTGRETRAPELERDDMDVERMAPEDTFGFDDDFAETGLGEPAAGFVEPDESEFEEPDFGEGFDEPGTEDDEFGLGLDVGPSERPRAEPPPREGERERRRGRRRRGRRPDRAETEPPRAAAEPRERVTERREPAAGEPDWSDEPEADLEDLEESGEDLPAGRWENIPTWEEAVAMLINPSRSSGRGSDGPDAERGGRPSRPRGNGGRRGRRRRG